MEWLIELINQWLPAVMSVSTTTIVVFLAKSALNQICSKLNVRENDLKTIKSEIDSLKVENHELVRVNKILIDKITKISGYTEGLKK